MDEFVNSADFDEELEDWGDIDTSQLVDEGDGAPETESKSGGEADQPGDAEAEAKGEERPEGENGAGQSAEEQKADQFFELKHLDETRRVNRDEVIALAQKGIDYDRIRAKLDELRGLEAQASENEQYAAFVKELADGAGISVEELIDSTRAKMLMDGAKRQGQSLELKDAMAQAKQTREAKTQADGQAKELRAARTKQERFAEEAGRFRTLFPDVKAEDIPPEVWQEYDRTGNLVDAWNRNQNSRLTKELEGLKTELEALRQEKKNQERSTGSRRSAGASSKSAVDAAWDEALANGW